jgi:hypothetical protein
MKVSPRKPLLPICLGNWTEQEVIELRRVQCALERWGIATDTSFGLSDEGDPWCVICRMGSTEVLAHFARIDATYVGYWEGLNYGRSGDSLHDVSDRFLNHQEWACRSRSRS